MYSFDDFCPFRVSLILPSNKPEFLRTALSEIAWHKDPDDQLIVIDDSADGAGAEAAREFDYLGQVITQQCGTCGSAWNLGLLIAVGRYIKFLADDDQTNWAELDKAVGYLDAHPEIDLLQCGGTKIVEGQEIEIRHPDHYGSRPKDVLDHGGQQMGTLVRRRALAHIGLLDPRSLCPDMAFVMAAIDNGLTVRPGDFSIYVHHVLPHSSYVARHEAWRKDVSKLALRYGYKVLRWAGGRE